MKASVWNIKLAYLVRSQKWLETSLVDSEWTLSRELCIRLMTDLREQPSSINRRTVICSAAKASIKLLLCYDSLLRGTSANSFLGKESALAQGVLFFCCSSLPAQGG